MSTIFVSLYMANKKYTKENLEPIVKECTSIRQVLLKLGLKETGGNYSNMSTRIKQFEIDTSHFTGMLWSKGKTLKTNIEHMLVEDSTYSNGKPRGTYALKNRLFVNDYKEKRCEICGITEWNGLPAPLELHHIDGVATNNTIENLQILCPNCHAQTDNYRGKNIGSKQK